jgi:hypothetical protein
VRKILPPLGFDPWTVQPVAIRYTDYATRPTHVTVDNGNYLLQHSDVLNFRGAEILAISILNFQLQFL